MTPRLSFNSNRRGLSLIEVIIAMGILVGTTAVLVQLISIGEKQANRAVDMTESQTICHNKMAELLSGLSMIVPVENEPAAVDSPWDYSIKIEPIGFRDLFSLTVIVTQHQEQLATSLDAAQSKPRSYHLTRWIRESDLPEGTKLNIESLDDDDYNVISTPRPVPQQSRGLQ